MKPITAAFDIRTVPSSGTLQLPCVYGEWLLEANRNAAIFLGVNDPTLYFRVERNEVELCISNAIENEHVSTYI